MEEMRQSLLLLHQRYTADDQAIWRAAIQRGWRTERIGAAKVDIDRKILGYKHIRYYGNVLHTEMCEAHLPMKLTPIDITALTRLESFTKRKIELVRAYDIQRPIQERKFYKCPGIKYIESRIYNVGETFDCKHDDWIYRQTPINITSEIRTFVLDGKILTASYYRNEKREFEPKELIDIPEEIREMARAIFRAEKWPRGIVFDFALMEDGHYCFLEANEAYASGLYFCDPDKCFDCIIASQE